MPTTVLRADLTRTVLAILLMVVLIGGSFWILRPFLLSTIWAMMIVVATWPMMLTLQARLRRRAVAVTIMSGVMVLVFVVPLLLAIQTLIENTDTIVGWVRLLATSPIPPPPEWLSRMPQLGAKIAEYWSSAAAASKEELASRLAPYAATAAQWLAGALNSVGLLGVQFLLTVLSRDFRKEQGHYEDIDNLFAMYLLHNLSKYRVRVNDETKLLEIEKGSIPMAYPEAAEAATRSAKSDSENFRRRIPFPRGGREIGNPTDESVKNTVPQGSAIDDIP